MRIFESPQLVLDRWARPARWISPGERGAAAEDIRCLIEKSYRHRHSRTHLIVQLGIIRQPPKRRRRAANDASHTTAPA